jgi:hypothetical protein
VSDLGRFNDTDVARELLAIPNVERIEFRWGGAGPVLYVHLGSQDWTARAAVLDLLRQVTSDFGEWMNYRGVLDSRASVFFDFPEVRDFTVGRIGDTA